MSFVTMEMAPTFPEPELLDAFDKMEKQTICGFAEIVYAAYHRGRRQQMICCMAQFMYHYGASYDEVGKIFNYPLIDGDNLREAVQKQLVIYAAMQQNEEA